VDQKICKYKFFTKGRIMMIKLFFSFVLLFVILLLFDIFTGTVCIFSFVTGFPCPGCGMTRAWLSFLQLDFKQAFFFHPLFLLPPFILTCYLIFKDKISIKVLNVIYILLIFVIIGVYTFRMIMYFPHIEPMIMNDKSIISKRLFQEIVLNLKLNLTE